MEWTYKGKRFKSEPLGYKLKTGESLATLIGNDGEYKNIVELFGTVWFEPFFYNNSDTWVYKHVHSGKLYWTKRIKHNCIVYCKLKQDKVNPHTSKIIARL